MVLTRHPSDRRPMPLGDALVMAESRGETLGMFR